MQAYKREFVEFLVRAGALTFGDFVTKSGRETPYFINLGKVHRGPEMLALARFYASAIRDRVTRPFDLLFGPAYKGIPLVVGTSMVLAQEHDVDVAYAFDRKEAKDHGEGGRLVGHVPRDGDRVLILEDVTTAGTSIRQTVPLLRAAARVELAGLVVALDRQEKGTGERAALAELEAELDLPAVPIVTIDEVVEVLTGREVDGHVVLAEADLERIQAYRARYGAV